MYGGVPREPLESKADQEFIEGMIKDSGSREAAFQEMIKASRYFFFKKDFKTAMKRLNQAWLLDPDNPEVFVGYGNVLGQMGQWDEFVKWNRKAAEQGQPDGQVTLGMAYLFGIGGLEQNPVEAAHWCRLSAEQGFSPAQNFMGVLYDWGYGVAQDPIEAAKWYELYDKQGYAPDDWTKLRKASLVQQGKDPESMAFQDLLEGMRVKLFGENQPK